MAAFMGSALEFLILISASVSLSAYDLYTNRRARGPIILSGRSARSQFGAFADEVGLYGSSRRDSRFFCSASFAFCLSGWYLRT